MLVFSLKISCEGKMATLGKAIQELSTEFVSEPFMCPLLIVAILAQGSFLSAFSTIIMPPCTRAEQARLYENFRRLVQIEEDDLIKDYVAGRHIACLGGCIQMHMRSRPSTLAISLTPLGLNHLDLPSAQSF